MAKSKFVFKLDNKIFKELSKMRNKLPDRATGSIHSEKYHDPAGLALLGQKDNKIDKAVYLKMDGGCWDAPEITFKSMDIGLQTMLKDDHTVVGMALLRHDNHYSSIRAKISKDMQRAIHSFKNSFEDITKTLWLSIGRNYFRIYRVKNGKEGRIRIVETKATDLYTGEKPKLLKEKITKDNNAKERRLERTKLRKAEEIRKIRFKKELENKAQTKMDKINQSLSDKNDSIVNIANGYCFLKQPSGEYILWKTN